MGRRESRALLFALLAPLAGCTIDVHVPTPNVTIECLELVESSGTVVERCPDAGAGDAAP